MLPVALASAGLHVSCAASRSPKTDGGPIMEKGIPDITAWIVSARDNRSHETVVLVGWSGGGALSLSDGAPPSARP